MRNAIKGISTAIIYLIGLMILLEVGEDWNLLGFLPLMLGTYLYGRLTVSDYKAKLSALAPEVKE